MSLGAARSRGPGGRAAATDLPQILRTAMAIIRAEGLAALTMRRLADELGVWTGTLYHHVGADKDQLLRLVVDAIAAEVQRPPLEVAWDERLRRILVSMHSTLLAYPGIAGYLLEHGVPGPNGVLINEALARAICDSGLDAEEAARIDLLLTTLAFSDAQQRTEPVDHMHDADELAAFAAQAPNASRLHERASEWAAGAHLEWAIDLSLAHIRSVTGAPA